MIRQQILDKVEESFVIAEKYYNRKFNRPNIIFKRNGTTAGYARRDLSSLMFQLDFAENNPEDFIGQICPHEVAHIIQFTLYPRSKPHGHEWKYIMRYVFGLDPDRCHSYDVSVTKTKQYKYYDYTCPCNTSFKLTSNLHNKIIKGQNRICNKCKGRLFIKPESADQLFKQLEELKLKLTQLSN